MTLLDPFVSSADLVEPTIERITSAAWLVRNDPVLAGAHQANHHHGAHLVAGMAWMGSAGIGDGFWLLSGGHLV